MIRDRLARWRWKWFLARRGLGFQEDYLERVYRIYLGHDKVVHYRDGHPVRSVTSPAVFSKPMANFMARILFGNIQNRPLPNMLSFAVNDVCNASCEHCSFFDGVEEKGRTVLSTRQAQKLIGDAQELGVSVITFLGGEPLLRNDLPEIIGSVNKDLSTTLLVTNGSLLADQAHVLKSAGLDSVCVSIDSADPVKHDLFRGTKGLYARAIAGIEKAKEVGLTVAMASTLTPESFDAGEFDDLVELARSKGVYEVLIFDAMPSGRYQLRGDLIDNWGWVAEMIKRGMRYNECPGYPAILMLPYTFSHRSAGCGCGTNYFYVSPYGDVMPCDFNHAKFGNVLDAPLYEIWDYLSSHEDFGSSKWGGCKVKDSEYLKKSSVVNGTGTEQVVAGR